MAVLDEANRVKVWAQFMRDVVGTLTGLTKPQVRAAVDAADQWVEDNTTSYNTALPAAFRTNASLVQKILLLCYVLMRRAGKLRAEGD